MVGVRSRTLAREGWKERMAAQTQFADFLLPELIAREDGTGGVVDIGKAQGKALSVTLGITRILEQESLEIQICGSADGANWGAKPLLAFPQKFYCGNYPAPLDLSGNPEVRFLRVQWKMARWGRGDPKPLFGFFVFAEETAGVLAAHGA